MSDLTMKKFSFQDSESEILFSVIISSSDISFARLGSLTSVVYSADNLHATFYNVFIEF